ncbi:MAG: hypothetical protein ABEJ82_09270 [Haloplanus sp.]
MVERADVVEASLEDRLVSVCRTAMGDSLRSITYFTPETYEQVYLRTDLTADADLAGSVEHEADGFHTQAAYRDSELGDYHYTVRAFENGFLLRVVGDDHGVFVTTDGLTIRRSKDVAAGLRDVLA